MKISIFLKLTGSFITRIYFFEVKGGNTGKIRQICSKLTIKTPKRRQIKSL